jgi:spore coat-associated protein N
MSRHSAGRAGPDRRLIAAAAFAVLALGVTGAGVYAALNATGFNASPQTVTSGTLSLLLTDSGDGFSQPVSAMAPGDTVNRYVNLTNGASLDASGLTLGVTATGSTLLSTDPTVGLQVSVTRCTGGTWTPGTGVCSGTTATPVTSSVNALLATPVSLVTGSIAKNTVVNLKVSVSLPDKTETTANGVPPAGTIQGLSTSLTWTFTEQQRTATTTTS